MRLPLCIPGVYFVLALLTQTNGVLFAPVPPNIVINRPMRLHFTGRQGLGSLYFYGDSQEAGERVIAFSAGSISGDDFDWTPDDSLKRFNEGWLAFEDDGNRTLTKRLAVFHETLSLSSCSVSKKLCLGFGLGLGLPLFGLLTALAIYLAVRRRRRRLRLRQTNQVEQTAPGDNVYDSKSWLKAYRPKPVTPPVEIYTTPPELENVHWGAVRA